jgi:hypothetical protein
MKVGWFLVLMMSWAAAVDGSGYARLFNQRSEPMSSKTREDAVAEHSGDGAKNPRGAGDGAGGGHPEQDQHRQATSSAPKFRPSRGHRQPSAGGPPHARNTQADHKVRVDVPGTAIDSRQTRSPSPGVPGGVLDHGRRSVRPPVAAALNGQQFTNARNPGARLAIRGGTANRTGGTAVINGTDMKRKP